jgi:hypothetical protein
MALPLRKPAHTPAPSPACDTTYTDECGIVYVDGFATVSISVDVKLSRQWQSAGVHAGMTFKTKADLVNGAVESGFKKLRLSLAPEIQRASQQLNEI